MRFDVFTLFPQMFQGPLTESIIKRAVERGIIQIHIHNIRDWATDKHKTTDDYPYGGGPGMVMKPEPIFLAVEEVLGKSPEERGDTPIILMSASGRRFEQKLAEKLSQKKRLALICGHYEGVDERVREHLATMELSIGDYVLSGGELPAMVVIDAVARLVPGVIDEESKKEESFTSGLLEYPQYTRPAEFRDMKVPDILLSGNHQAIASWRLEQALKRTQQVRPDLAAKWVQAHRAKQKEEDC
ncbi:tRNA (guanine-N1)-methyltransferase [Thermobaculum terrenum ATCC BAA-798]|uniref:tRNA (guanine-N(1)-)-methyltransferase n=1 Tax=Thermobaculum terrenum (strain ATCC BAA-798 / CCMEE 7001 / YNP1) TaxID=525904 RepID=D1CFB7_THET1|nr:tRNA (guanosine(37)-N1)-methyltransferase TrmD [Thermobaculum terrenum]ACZ41623.1 tRNA (guanine-N1)-methyltransferase [Thermobaculum terrenum ATCC BAA-798]